MSYSNHSNKAQGKTQREESGQVINRVGSLRCRNILVAGPSSSGKTSILLDMACAVAYRGGRVLFVTHQESLCKEVLYNCISPNKTASQTSWTRSHIPSCLRKIDIKYFEINKSAIHDIVNYFSKLHMGSAAYEMIIMENFDAYFFNLKQFLCAISLVENARSYFASRLRTPVTIAFSSTLTKNRYYNSKGVCADNSSGIGLLNAASSEDLQDTIKYLKAYKRIVDRVIVIKRCEKLHGTSLNKAHHETLKKNRHYTTMSSGAKYYEIRCEEFSSRNVSSLAKLYFSFETLRRFSSSWSQNLHVFKSLCSLPDKCDFSCNKIASYYIDAENGTLVFLSA